MLEPERTGVHDLDDAADVVLYGPMSSDRIGESLSGEIDMDNDGVNDLIIGSPYTYDSMGRGKAFLLYGCSPKSPTGSSVAKVAARTLPSRVET